MAAPDFSAATALANKAAKLLRLGHFARAADKYGQALDAALAQRCPDCLVVARLQIDHASTLGSELDRKAATAAEEQACRATMLSETLAAAATLRRRRAAGTLLGGRCTAAELTWYQQTSEALVMEEAHRHWSRETDRVDMCIGRRFFGYNTLLLCAVDLANATLQCRVGRRFAMTAAQQRECWALLAEAVDCLARPRPHQRVTLHHEGLFVMVFRTLLSEPACMVPRDELGARLLAAWQRLERSGVLQRRNVQEGALYSCNAGSALSQAAAAAATAPGLRSCGLDSCGAREAHPQHFKFCAACRGVAYCSKEHQAADWPRHKAACKAAAAAVTESSTAAAGPSGT